MYTIQNSDRVDRIFKKLSKRNPELLRAIAKKLPEIAEDPHRFKPLSNVMAGFYRIHFGSYVLIFSIDEKEKIVLLEDYEHHDKIYMR